MAEPSKEEIAETLGKLRDIHLPELTDAAILADWAAAASLGLFAALLLILLASAFVRRSVSDRKDLLAALTASRGLAPAERLLAQAKILQELAAREARKGNAEVEEVDWRETLGGLSRSEFFVTGPGAALREDLYRPNPASDPEAFDRELVALLKRAGG